MSIITTHQHKISDTILDALMTILYASFIILSTDVAGAYIMLSLVACIFLINFIATPSRGVCFHFSSYNAYILLFALFALVSSLWALNPEYSVEKAVTLFSIFVCFYILYSTYFYANIERLLKIIMYGGFIVALYSISFYGLNNIMDTLSAESRLETDFANVNAIGMALCSSVIIALFLFKQAKNYISLILCIPSAIIIAGTGSRKALVILILGLVFVFLHQNREKKISKKLLKIIGSIIILAIVVYAGIASGIFAGSMARMEGLIASFTGEGQVDSSTMLRTIYRDIGYQQFLETPFLGIGVGNARILALSATEHDCYLHDNYAEMAASGGIIGLIICYWIYIPIIKKEWKARKIDSYAPLILFLVILQLVGDYGVVSYYSKQTYFLLMVVMLHIDKLKNLKLAK